ncbi:MAG: tetratricopeptide repeat protein [Gammaproteobacteria bacterium]|jgi:tetratricopeptide (TPR) repeat protein
MLERPQLPELDLDSATGVADALEKGRTLQLAGKMSEAKAVYARILDKQPDHAQALYMLGALAFETGRVPAAEQLIRKAIEANPTSPRMHNELGIVLKALGRMDEAEASHRKAIALAPRFAGAHNSLGTLCERTGRLDDAIASYRRAVELEPGFAIAWGNLALALRAAGRQDEALEALRSALEAAPGDPRLLNTTGMCLSDLGRHEDAVECLRHALEAEPNFADAWNNLGLCLRRLGRDVEAVDAFERALATRRDFPQAMNNLGISLTNLGRFEEAAARFRAALKLAPDFHLPLLNLVDAEMPGLQSEEVDQLHALASGDELPAGQRAQARFALGRIYEHHGEPEEAFRQFEAGNRLHRQTLPAYDREAEAALFSRIRATYSEIKDTPAPEDTGNPASPIFIVGMIRSGTTLIERILAAHPEVHPGGELKALARAVAVAAEGRFPDAPALADAEAMDRLAEAYFRQIEPLAREGTRITDKMPGNFLYLGLIARALPGARIIHCRRDARDTCLSAYTTMFAEGQPWSYDLEDLGHYYGLYRELMTHWRQTLPAGRMLELDYEALVESPEEQARRVVEFCGLEWSDDCLDFHRKEGVVRTASQAQVRRPVYRDSVGRWRRWEDQLAPLLRALGDG